MSICGLDFGTSNTTLGTVEGQAPVLVALEAAQTTYPVRCSMRWTVAF